MEKIDGILKHLNKISFRGPIGLFIVIASFAFIFLIIFKAIPVVNKDVVLLAIGFVLAMAKDVSGWYFGSSKEKADAEKSAQVKDLLAGNNTTPEKAI